MQNIAYTGENDTRAVRDVVSEAIPRMCAENPDVIYLDADMMSAINIIKWGVDNPERALNCGIAEANMIGIACGLAAAGFKPIVHSFGPFSSRRVFDQVFLSAGYARNDITVLGSDPGVTATLNGGTHMPFEDVALYRTIPTATVVDVTDANCFLSVIGQCLDRPGVKYLRMPRKSVPKVYSEGAELTIGKAYEVREGRDAAVLACGLMVAETMKAAEILAAEGIEIAVYDFFTVKPLDRERVLDCARRFGSLVVAENHNRIGGLYSAVAELLAAECPTPVEYVAVEDEYGEVGPQDYLQERFGLTAAKVVEKVKRAIARKG